jgi:uncharacterized membrane protein YgdD (TMEM256/DUF423 family)
MCKTFDRTIWFNSEIMRSIFLAVAALNGLAAVTIGAAAQHLWAGDPHAAMLAETGIRYGLPHAAVLAALAAISPPASASARRLLAAVGASLALGATLFSGSLYALAASGNTTIGRLVPVGGSLMILGWILLLGFSAVWTRRS